MQQYIQAQVFGVIFHREKACSLHERQALGLAHCILNLAFYDERSLLNRSLFAAECFEVHNAPLFPLILHAIGARETGSASISV